MSWHGRIGGWSIDGAEPLGHLLDALPLAATDSRRDVGHVRLEIVLQSPPLPRGHAAEQDEQTDVAQDRLT